MKDTGEMTYNMVTEKKFGLMVHNMKVTIMKARSMEKALINGLMVVLT